MYTCMYREGAGKTDDTRYWIWLAERTVGRGRIRELLEQMGSARAVYFAGAGEYGDEPGDLTDKSLRLAMEILRRCEAAGIRVLTYGDSRYPERLRQLEDPPTVLYVRGDLGDPDDEPVIALVGTRKCTPFGVRMAEKLGRDIARYGGVLATGLAAGIDSAAARGALSGGGLVIGVLGCGADVVYPRSNGPLFEDVLRHGALISEYPPGTPPLGRNFPERNRIMSGISLGVAVVEAPERSGALITAGAALEQGRDVFVVPANPDAESCKGSNLLLQEGAYPVLNGWDIMSQYRHLFPGLIQEP